MAEAGFPEAGVDSWLPGGPSPDVVKRLMTAAQEAASDPEVRERLTTPGAASAFLDTSGFDAFLQADRGRAQRVVSLVENQPR